MNDDERPLEWIGSSYKDLMQLPADVRKFFGFALSFAQQGEQHAAAKVLKGFGGAGVLELVENDAGDSFCAALLSEEEQERHRHTESGHGRYPRPVEGGGDSGEGDET